MVDEFPWSAILEKRNAQLHLMPAELFLFDLDHIRELKFTRHFELSIIRQAKRSCLIYASGEVEGQPGITS